MPYSLYSCRKKVYYQLTTYPLPCLVLFFIFCRHMRMYFQIQCHLGCHRKEGLNIKFNLFLELNFQSPTVPHQPQRNKRNSAPSTRIAQQRVCKRKSLSLCCPCSFSSQEIWFMAHVCRLSSYQ